MADGDAAIVHVRRSTLYLALATRQDVTYSHSMQHPGLIGLLIQKARCICLTNTWVSTPGCPMPSLSRSVACFYVASRQIIWLCCCLRSTSPRWFLGLISQKSHESSSQHCILNNQGSHTQKADTIQQHMHWKALKRLEQIVGTCCRLEHDDSSVKHPIPWVQQGHQE